MWVRWKRQLLFGGVLLGVVAFVRSQPFTRVRSDEDIRTVMPPPRQSLPRLTPTPAAPAVRCLRMGAHELWGDADVLRERWEQGRGRPFPGSAWTERSECGAADRGSLGDSGAEVPHVQRKDWALPLLERFLDLRSQGLKGLEIGACSLPLAVPPQVDMSYADLPPEKNPRGCQYYKGSGPRIDIWTEAQTLAGVQSRRFDFVAGFHVMEHMHDVISALRHWLRVVRPGGLVLFAVPDACSCVERARRVTSPQHFVDDFRENMTAERSIAQHMEEMAVLFGSAKLYYVRKGIGDETDRNITFEVCRDLHTSVPWKHALEVPWESLAAAAREYIHTNPAHGHLHVWSVSSMRRMLAAAQLELRGVSPFEIVDVRTSASGFLQMRELRVALRRGYHPRTTRTYMNRGGT
eukprot:Hpha_TRINITY_DN418_c0_g1::TRINITY_DN418_c0_g1_i1::g.27574::m.27574